MKIKPGMTRGILQMALYLASGTLAMPSLAAIDALHGNYTFTVRNKLSSPEGLDLARTYNSRSQIQGIFGRGWCSSLETRLEATAEGNLKIIECGAGRETVFAPARADRSAIAQMVNRILGKVSATGRGDETRMRELKSALQTNDALRVKFARAYGLLRPVSRPAVYLEHGVGPRFIKTFDARMVVVDDEVEREFDNDGRLRAITDANQHGWRLNYENQQLANLEHSGGERIVFVAGDGGRVSTIEGYSRTALKPALSFTYNSSGFLLQSSYGGAVETYAYDEHGHLNRRTTSLGKTDEITYLGDQGVPREVKQGQCSAIAAKMPAENQQAGMERIAVTRRCAADDWERTSTIDVSRTSNALGESIIASIRVGASALPEGQRRIAHYARDTGQLVTVSDDLEKSTQIRYDARGRVTSRREWGEMVKFKYDGAALKPSQLSRKTNDRQGRTDHYTMKLAYWPDGRLSQIAHSDGRQAHIEYDRQGRLSKVSDGKGQDTFIEYESIFGKPSRVQMTGIGSLEIEYDETGEISRTHSADGSHVVMAIAGTFSKVLKLVAQAKGGDAS